MKKLITTAILALFLYSPVKSQISLENTYAIPNNSYKAGLTTVKLDVSGDKYCLYDYEARTITLYNLNHSVFKMISIPALPKYRTGNTDSLVSIAYITENLFNSDNLIEYVTFDGQFDTYLTPSYYGSMMVFNENGSAIFDGDSLMPSLQRDATYYGYEGEGDFIFNTSAGSKMILFSYKNNVPSQQVYSLPGRLTTSIQNINENKNPLPFPNPAINSITLPYKLENGKAGKLVINDPCGKIVIEYAIDTTFDNVIVDTNSLSSGNYFYSYSSDKKISTGKFIVTK